jgi:hypothetical protein
MSDIKCSHCGCEIDGTRDWLSMASAPMDGTVIEACARFRDETSGFPQYVSYTDGTFRALSGRAYGEPLVCWAWRPRTDWPSPSPHRFPQVTYQAAS